MAISRVADTSEGQSTIVSAFKQLLAIEKDLNLPALTSFYLKFVDSLFATGHIEAANAVKQVLLSLPPSTAIDAEGAAGVATHDVTLEDIMREQAVAPAGRMYDYRANDQTLTRSDFFFGEVCEAIYTSDTDHQAFLSALQRFS